MATGKTWTDDEVFAIAQVAYMCGTAEGIPGFGRATIGRRATEFMPLLEEVLVLATPSSPAGRRKLLALASALGRHFQGEVHALVRDVRRRGRPAAMKLWCERAGLAKESA
jgi:hypothetical protein